MPNLYDLCYAAGLAAAAPVWLVLPSARRKVFTALRERMGRDLPGARAGPTVLIHAVSVGEINATPALVAALRQDRPDLRFVVSTTTATGFERSRQLYPESSGVAVIRYPLDFTCAVGRVLDGLRPSAVVLMELEVWPNFLRQCRRRGIPVIVAAGRITEPAYRSYKLAGPVTRAMFRRLSAVAAQDQTFADRFAALGVPGDRLQVLGTMKFDSATIADRIDGDSELAAAVGLRPGSEPIWLCGSTGEGEEQIALEAYRRLLADHPGLRLVIVPRHPPRFDAVAELISRQGFALVRRSRPGTIAASAVVLGDTMGELRKFYSLADVVFVGRSLVDLGPRQHGSDMIEPAALGKPVIVGPYTGNFDMPVRLLRAANAVLEVATADGLKSGVERLLRDPPGSQAMGRRAQDVVRAAQGSTRRHAQLIASLL